MHRFKVVTSHAKSPTMTRCVGHTRPTTTTSNAEMSGKKEKKKKTTLRADRGPGHVLTGEQGKETKQSDTHNCSHLRAVVATATRLDQLPQASSA